MRFPPDFIERLKSHLPLSQVIGKRIAVKKFGREYKALCPFHNEKSPSFTINDDKEFFHCFGCGAHGDAIGFIKDYDKLTYREAVERLASEAGIPLPAASPQEEERYKKALTLYDAVEEAAQWFQKQLLTSAGAEARDYLARRGVSQEMVALFRLGFAPDGREALKSHLLKKGFAEATLVETGLAARPEDGGATYDRFRNRLMFPISTASGKPVAFSGRILPSAEAQVRAKYLNSPETPLFKKGEMLFGLNLARRSIADKQSAVIAEGNLDVVALHQAGFTHAVAPLGTALTPEQLQLLWRGAPEPILCFDGDAAGQRAMMRAAELALPLMRAGNGLRFTVLPEGQDPDSLIAKRGAAAMQAALDQAATLSQVLWSTHENHVGTATPEQRARLESTLTGVADTIADASLRQHFRDYFKQQLWDTKKAAPAPKRGGNPQAKRFVKERDASPAVRAMGAGNEDTRHRRFEEQILCLLLQQPMLLQQADVEEGFARLAFADKQLDKVRDAILQHHGETEATSRKSLKNFLDASGLAEMGDRLWKQAATLVPKSLQGDDVNMHDAALVWRQVLSAYGQTQVGENDNAPMSEEAWERLRERVTAGEPPRAHLIFPEEN